MYVRPPVVRRLISQFLKLTKQIAVQSLFVFTFIENLTIFTLHIQKKYNYLCTYSKIWLIDYELKNYTSKMKLNFKTKFKWRNN